MIKIGGLIVSKGSEFLPEVLGLIEKRLSLQTKNVWERLMKIYRRYARTLTV